MTNDEVKNKIKAKGYWRVVIRPAERFHKNNYFRLDQLEGVVENAQVQLRGWYYPHIDTKTGVKISDENRISNFCDWEEHIEYWEFTTSGQFGHIFGMREDYEIDETKAAEIRSQFRFDKERVKKVNKFFEIVNANYRITEVYLFALNLAQLKEFSSVQSFEIIIEFHDVRDRMLFIWDSFRQLWQPYVCGFENNRIEFKYEHKKEDLIANFDSFALDFAKKLFIRFGWKDPNEQAMREDQKKLLERRF